MRSLLPAVVFGLILLGSGALAQNTPAYPGAVLFVSNPLGGEENRHITELTKPAGTLKCGQASDTVEVSWKFLERSPKGDVYELTRNFPANIEAASAKSRKIIYDNAPIEVWKDGHLTVMLKPKEP